MTTMSELRNAVRSLRHTPTVAVSAILCLTLGVGATVAIASAVNRALIQPLPFARPNELVAVHRVTPNSGPLGTFPQSVLNYLDLAASTRQLRGLAAVFNGTALLETPQGGIQASQLYVTGNLFPLLEARPERGRLLGLDEDRPDQPSVAVLSDEFWREKLGGDPSIVGKSLTIDGQPTTILGILPPDFRIPHGGNILRADVWSPARFVRSQFTSRRSNFLLLLGRLAPHATVQSADAEMHGLFAQLVAEHPELHGEGLRVAELQSDSVRNVRQPLLLMFGAVCMVLLIAATNVAALLLARGVQRRREMAVRTALGASKWDAMRPALMESVVISLIGAAAGLGLALVAVRTIGVLAARRMPQLAGLTIDVKLLAFAIVLSLLVALLCGAVPAWRGAAVDPQDALRGGRGGGAGREQHRALRGLVTLEIALSLVLLIGAGLELNSFRNLLDSDPGFETAHVLTMSVAVPAAAYQNGDAVRNFLEPALAAIRSTPGVEAAGAISTTPFINWGNNSNIRYEGTAPADPTTYPVVEQRSVDPNFFSVTGQRLLAGRGLSAADDERPETPGAVVVNQALVDRDFKGANPVGKRFFATPSGTTFVNIVGVVSNIRNMGPFLPTAPEMYWTYRQSSLNAVNFPLMIRARGNDPGAVISAVRAAVLRVAPSAAITRVLPMPEVIAQSLGRPRFYLAMLGSFAVIAIVLAVAGLYGVLSYAVAQRTRELGIRSALGSSENGLVRLMAAEGARLIALGLVLGYVGGSFLTRLMASMLYGSSAADPRAWVGAGATLAVAAAAATIVPARRAARADPMTAIRNE